MRNHPVRIRRDVARAAASNEGELAPRAASKERELATRSGSASAPFASFRYSYTEISIGGGKAHMRSRRAQLENGRLTTEAFDGEVDRTAYEHMVAQAQRVFAAQAALFLRPLALFLPFLGTRSRDRE